jgi:light-regulated signal transduction histidine kinase (bacteriophytochrome)
MSISLLVDGKLWGLIACHHREARPLSYAVRAACELFGQVASLEISAQQEARRLAEHVQATAIQTRFFDILANEHNVMEALVRYTPYLLEFMGATGAVICVNDKITQLGATPPRTFVEGLIAHLRQISMNPVFATDSLSGHWPEAAACQDIASGLLAVRLSQVEHSYVLWFRPEVISTITWAGNPAKPTDDQGALHPRQSFQAWTQEVTGHSLAWGETELQGARELRTALNALVLRRNQRLMLDNAELEKKNTDLNSFAYIAAHDLKEPLRGITNYSNFLQEDYGASLPTEAMRRLEKISALATRSEGLLDSLNRFSKLGRMEITSTDCDIDQVLDEVLENLGELIRESGVEVRRTHPLPHKSCDPILIREVLANLVANAIRYNTAAEKWVEIGVRENEDPVTLYIRDNGIGIREKNHDVIFTMFRRLHAYGEYGEGTGAGLAIARNIVERHGGRIWVESSYGAGATFLFTLP